MKIINDSQPVPTAPELALDHNRRPTLPVLSRHACVRMQQRGIPEKVVECLLENGSRQYDHCGGQIVYFDKRSWRRAERAGFAEQINNFDRFRRAYAVVMGGETVATVGHRYYRIRRH